MGEYSEREEGSYQVGMWANSLEFTLSAASGMWAKRYAA